MIEVLKKYFPNLSEQQLAAYEKLIPVYEFSEFQNKCDFTQRYRQFA